MISVQPLTDDGTCHDHARECGQFGRCRIEVRARFVLMLAILVLYLAQPVAYASQRLSVPTAYLFMSSACQDCDRAIRTCRRAEMQLRNTLQIRVCNVLRTGNLDLLRRFLSAYGLDETSSVSVPILFVGDVVLTSDELTDESVAETFRYAVDYGQMGPSMDVIMSTSAYDNDVNSIGLSAVLVSGFADGVNPCAFATLAFFMSYLIGSGLTESRTLTVGMVFALGVFCAYLAMGAGLYDLLGILDANAWSRLVIRLIGATTAVALGMLSAVDAVHAIRDQRDRVIIRLPRVLISRLHAVIRRLRASRFLLPATFLTGVVVSGLEFVCTGQVYIPTILYMMSQAEGRRGAITLLVLYNLAFISPMVAILLAVRSGLSRSRLGQLSKKSVGAAKLLMALMLLFIGAFMIAEEVGGLL